MPWLKVDPIPAKKSNYTTTLLEDGRVLLVGGTHDDSISPTCWLFEHGKMHWTQTGSMNIARGRVALATLADGRVLAVGGETDLGLDVTKAVEIFDPATEQWTRLKDYGRPIRNLQIVPLDNGDALIIGGDNRGGAEIRTVKRFDAKTDELKSSPPLVHERVGAGAAIVEGSVIVVGGEYEGSTTTEVNMLEKKSSEWCAVGNLSRARVRPRLARHHDSLLCFGGSYASPGFNAVGSGTPTKDDTSIEKWNGSGWDLMETKLPFAESDAYALPMSAQSPLKNDVPTLTLYGAEKNAVFMGVVLQLSADEKKFVELESLPSALSSSHDRVTSISLGSEVLIMQGARSYVSQQLQARDASAPRTFFVRLTRSLYENPSTIAARVSSLFSCTEDEFVDKVRSQEMFSSLALHGTMTLSELSSFCQKCTESWKVF